MKNQFEIIRASELIWCRKLVILMMVLFSFVSIQAVEKSDVVSNQSDEQNVCTPRPGSGVIVNVRKPPYSARGDGVHDDTQAIQDAINAVQGTGGVVQIPEGTYLINPLHNPDFGGHGLRIGSRMTLRIDPGATLKAIPVESGSYMIVAVVDVRDVNLLGGGVILGERNNHIGTTGEWGMGVSISGSHDIAIIDIGSHQNWGDGFYIGGDLSTNIAFCNVKANANRRQGMSITHAKNVIVNQSVFSNTKGAPPENGIDIEPNEMKVVSDVVIKNSVFENNAGGGFQTGTPTDFSDTAEVRNVTFENNEVIGNGVDSVLNSARPGVEVMNSTNTVIMNNRILDNTGFGLRLRFGAKDTIVKGNLIQGTKIKSSIRNNSVGSGIWVRDAEGSRIEENKIFSSAGFGIYFGTDKGKNVNFNKNILHGNKKYTNFHMTN